MLDLSELKKKLLLRQEAMISNAIRVLEEGDYENHLVMATAATVWGESIKMVEDYEETTCKARGCTDPAVLVKHWGGDSDSSWCQHHGTYSDD